MRFWKRKEKTSDVAACPREPSKHKLKAASAKEKLSTLAGERDIPEEERPIIEAMRQGATLSELLAMRRALAENGDNT